MFKANLSLALPIICLFLAACAGSGNRTDDASGVSGNGGKRVSDAVLEKTFAPAIELYENGNYEEAENSFKDALARAGQSGASAEVLAPYRLAEAKSLLAASRLDSASQVLEEALQSARARWGESEKLYPYYMTRIRILYKGKKFEESQKEALELLGRQEKRLGKDSRVLIETLNLVIAAACAEDRCADTRPYLERQLRLRRKYLGDSHEHVAASLAQLAEIEEQSGNLDRAEELYTEVIKIREKSAPHLLESSRTNLTRIKLKRMDSR